MAECVASFVFIKRTAHVFPLRRGGRRNPSKLSDNVLESIELFKLMKPSMSGRERKVVEQWSVRWEERTGFIDCKQGS